MSEAKRDVRFELGDWSVDPPSGTVSRGEASVRLEPKVMKVLLELVEHPGQVVSKERLIDAVWADSFVGEAALSRCVSELRRALGDDARNPRYVETLPKRGYRIVAEVRSVATDAQPETSAPRRPPTRPPWQPLLAGAVAFALLGGWWATRAPTDEATDIESIAVLSLRALSDDPEQRFFAEGLTNQLIAQLATVRTFRVVSGMAARQARDARAPLRSIAGSLRVDALIDGTVQQSAGRILVSLELVDGTTEELVWAGAYQETRGDLLQIEQEIAMQATREITVALTLRQGAAERPAVEITEARQALDRARRLAARGTPVDSVRSLEEFRQALAIDPGYAEAWAALADVHATLGWNNWSDPTSAYAEARAAAYAALDQNPLSAPAHAVLAAVAAELNQDWPEAQRRFLTALQLDPRSPIVLERYGRYLRRLGRLEEAVVHSRRAVDNSDEAAPVLLSHARNLMLSGQYDAALDLARRALELDNDGGQPYAVLCAIDNLEERFEQALGACTRAAATPGHDLDLGAVGYAYAHAGQQQRARRVLEDLQRAGDETVTALAAATVRLGLGETDEALSLIEMAAQRRSLRLAAILEDPYLRQLRNEPRFAAVLDDLALPLGDAR